MISENDILKLARQLMIELNQQEIDELKAYFKVLERHLDLLNEIDTEGVEPMVYGRMASGTYMREDSDLENLELEEVFSNAPSRQDDFFSVSTVVQYE